MTDTEGKEIEVGSHVVYNMSGELYRGRVVKITKSKRYGRDHTVFHVQLAGTDHISKVGNRKSIFVI